MMDDEMDEDGLSNEYSEDADELIDDGNGRDDEDCSAYTRKHRNNGSDAKTNGSLGEGGLNAATVKFLEEKKEVTYSAYGNNIESCVKLLSCSKNIKLVENNRDIKAKRMFVTSYASIKEQRTSFGQGKLGKQTFRLLDESKVFNKQVRRAHYLDR